MHAGLAALLALAWPGAGHLYLRRFGRGFYFMAIVLAAVFVGWRLEGALASASSTPLETLGTIASMGLGVPYFVLRFALDYSGDMARTTFEYGGAFLLCAGLMNLLLVLDAWDVAHGRKS